MKVYKLALVMLCLAGALHAAMAGTSDGNDAKDVRERISINTGWRFSKGDPKGHEGVLQYDLRPQLQGRVFDARPADTAATEAVRIERRDSEFVLKPWILPSGNDFIRDSSKRHKRPDGDPGSDVPYVRMEFDDSKWERVDLPHDWAITGPFFEGEEGVGGGMGRLPSPGIGWYRRELFIAGSDTGKSIFLDVDGAMSYAMVWLNGHLVGGWPFGYSSWRLDLTPYAVPGGDNQLVIRLDNPPESSRWYPGGGIYRNVWLVKAHPVHVAQWGTFISTPQVSKDSATVNLELTVDNDHDEDAEVSIRTAIHGLDSAGTRSAKPVARFARQSLVVQAGSSAVFTGSVVVSNPRLWGPYPEQEQNRYVAVTEIWSAGKRIDTYETAFGIRQLRYDAETGVHVNGQRIYLKGVNNHHDLGALGAAFNTRAAERQLEILREMGCNSIRMSHNPPAPELLELTDRMGFLVVDEAFDVWERKKTPLDFHLLFPDWHEQDLRSMVRRDRNHPSVIMWSTGNEVGEQYTEETGAALAARLREIVLEEDPTRPTTASMNWAKPHMPFPRSLDLISLNYQGEGIRQDPIFEGTDRIRTKPQFPLFHETFPEKVIVSSESASAFSSRGIYLFPVTPANSSYTRDGIGGDSSIAHVSSYELYAVDFGSSADKVFASQDRHPYVAGEYVWTGFDYLGEPTPYYSARSSYTGIVDLAGFRKDRFYLYQSRWRPELPMAHILPHWNWPDRVGQVTPVHVFTSGDEAELFLNGRSLGRKKKGVYEYRLRWDDVIYEPGMLQVKAYRNGEPWADDVVQTAGGAAAIAASADRSVIRADGCDLSFITIRLLDENGLFVANATNHIEFELSGPGEIIATDNGDPTSFVPFQSLSRDAFSGLCLVVVRALPGQAGMLELKASGNSLKPAVVSIETIME